MNMEQLQNPYIVGPPLRDKNIFFGRQDVLTWANRQLINPSVNSIVLFGQRRIGKTSLLLQLANTLSSEDFVPIYCDLQDFASKPLGIALYTIALRATKSVHLPPPKFLPVHPLCCCFNFKFKFNFCSAIIPFLHASIELLRK